MPSRLRRNAPRRRLLARLRRRRLGRGLGRGRIGRFPRTPIHSFKRTWFNENYFSTGATGPTLAGLNFRLDMLPNYTEFTNLYDMYRINKIVVKLIPKVSEVGMVLGATNNSAGIQIHSALDFDDSAAPTNVSQLTQYSTYKMTRGHNIHTRVFVPKCELSANGTANAAPKAYQWLDTAHPDVAHYGMKLIIPTISANTIVYYDYSVTAYFSCKSVI